MLLLTLCLGLCATAVQAQTWTLVWADEFDTDGLPDPARWSYDVGGDGWGNQELQYYTENRTENARVENGVLVIEAHKEDFSGRAYTSARLVTREKGDWQYGRIEVRAQLPAGRGTWPAIWMLPTTNVYGSGGWPDNGEIDIMEHVGFDPERVHGTVHTKAYNHIIGTQRGGARTVPGALDTFHTYSITWSPKQIDFYIDETVYFRHFNQNTGWTTWPFDRPFHLLLNLAVGGSWGGLQGIDDAAFPARMAVDYVRVYENTALPEVELTAPATANVGEALTFTAAASVPQGTLESVTFFQDEGVLGTVTEAPYMWTLTGAAQGCYRIAARATDALGWSTTTAPLDLSVGTGCGQAPYLIAAHPIPGRIEAEYYDLGGEGVGYRDLDPQNQGSGLRAGEGVDIEATADEGGGYEVVGTAGREWLQYTVHVQETGLYTLNARVGSPVGSGAFRVLFNGVDQTGAVQVPATGGWHTVTVDSVALEAGPQVMRVHIIDGGFSLNAFTLNAQTATGANPDFPTDGFALDANYPNPFSGETRIGFTLPAAAPVLLDVFDVYGRRIARLLDRPLAAGTHHTAFAAQGLPNGVYYYRLATPQAQIVRAMTFYR